MKIARKVMQPGVPAVAMADIAFNLVLFFIMMAKTQDDSFIKWQPANAATKLQSTGNAKVSVAVDTQQKLYLNGQQIGISQLKDAIERELKDAPAGKRIVLLKIHKETTAQVFEPIVEAVSQAGGELMHILEEKRGGSS